MIENNKEIIQLFYQTHFYPNMHMNCASELMFIVSIMSHDYKSANDKLVLMHLLFGIIYNYIFDRLTINNIDNILDLYFEKIKDN